MNRNHIRTTLLKHLCENVDGLQGQEIDSRKSMLDLGATSLDIVEVVSSTMRELKITVARTELAKLETMDALIDVLFAAATAAASASGVRQGMK